MKNRKKQAAAAAMAVALGITAIISPAAIQAKEEPAAMIQGADTDTEPTEETTVTEQTAPPVEQEDPLQGQAPPASEPELPNLPEQQEISRTPVMTYNAVNKTDPADTDVDINAKFPDPIFRQYVSDNFDTSDPKDGKLSPEEISNIKEIEVIGDEKNPEYKKITTLEGIEKFTALIRLNLKNTAVEKLNISSNKALQYLRCDETKITELDISQNMELEYLNCYNNAIKSLDVSGHEKLKTLLCQNNAQLTSLIVDGACALYELHCFGTGITELNVSSNTALGTLDCSSTSITELDISKNKALTFLRCDKNGKLVSLNVNGADALESLNLSQTGVTSLDVSSNPVLSSLNCEDTPIAWLNVGNNQNLTDIYGLTPAIYSDTIEDSFDLKEIAKGIDLKKVKITGNGTMDSSGIVSVTDINQPVIYEYDCGTADGKAVTLTVAVYTAIKVSEKNFPDPIFRQYVSDYFDTSNPKKGKLTVSELNNCYRIDVCGLKIDWYRNIKSLKGLEYFTNLRELACGGTVITELDVSNNKKLELLECQSTKITKLDVSNNKDLVKLWCFRTGITSLDVSQNLALAELECEYTNITELDVSQNLALDGLQCNGTQITELDVSRNKALTFLDCSDCDKLTSLNVTGADALLYFKCYGTGIKGLDVSKNKKLLLLDLHMKDYGSTLLAWMNVGNNENLRELYWIPAAVHNYKIVNSPFNIKDFAKGIDPKKVTIKSNGSIDRDTGIVRIDDFNTPLEYSYDCGTMKDKQPVILDVTLNVSKGDSTLEFPDTLDTEYTGQPFRPAVNKTGSTKEAAFTYEIKNGDTWEAYSGIPTDIGTYRIQAFLDGDDYCNGTESEKKEFTIRQAVNSWTDGPAITGWTYGEKANLPTAAAKFGNVEFSYSDSETGVFTDKVPVNAGTWYLKAAVEGTDNYTGLESIIKFTVAPQNVKDGISSAGKPSGDKDHAARTGDGALIGLWALLAALAGGAAVFTKKRRL